MNGPEWFFVKKSKFHDAGGPDTVVSPIVYHGEMIIYLK